MSNARLLFLIALVNFIGFIYGIYYYSEQLLEWPFIFWIFIMDCPIQALLVSITLMLFLFGKHKSTLFNLTASFTAIGSIKYGLWTMFVILLYKDFFLHYDSFMYSILFLAHLGLFLEGLILSGFIKLNSHKISIIQYVLIIGFYLLNDILDYFLGTHPLIPTEKIEIVKTFTFLLTPFSIILFLYSANYTKKIISRFLS